MVDMNGVIEPESISLCPCCDQPMFDYEEVCLIESGGCKCLAHSDCVRGCFDEEDDD